MTSFTFLFVKNRACFLLVALVLLPLKLSAEITDSRFLQPSPTGDWITLETMNFRINFKKENQDYAERLAGIAERQHERLVDRLNWLPTGKTEIIVNDKVDYSNGASTVHPYNQFYVYLNEPVDGTLKDHIEFTETLFTHEYTHILQMDQAKGLPAKIRRVFGKSSNGLLVAVSMPQLLAPHWISEGIAIYTESQSGFGRNNSPVFNAMMREEVATGLASFKEESYEGYYGSRWPFGQVYLYGAYFYQFLEQTYGKRAVTDYFDHYSDNVIPWKVNERARKTTGKSAEDLWEEFQAYLRLRFQPEIDARNVAGLTQGEVLFDNHWQNRLISAGPNGSVYVYNKDELHTPKIIQLLPDGTSQSILELKGVTSLNWHEKGGLLLSILGVCENSSLYADLYRYDTERQNLEKLTDCARIPRATWAADGQSIYAVQTTGSYNVLVAVSMAGEVEPLHKMQLGESIGFPVSSPDSSIIVVPVKRRVSGWNLEAYHLQSRQWRALTQDSAIYSLPFFTQGGREVCFVSDITDTPELHCMELASGAQAIKTRSRGFINAGIASTDGSFWVSEYTANGDVIRKIKPVNGDVYGSAAPLIEKTKPLLIAQHETQTSQQYTFEPYNALKTLRPRGWAPLLAGNSDSTALGATVTGSDVLGFHSWALSPVVFNQNDETHLGGVFTYSYNDRLSLLVSDVWTVAFEDDDGAIQDKPTYTEATKNAQAIVHFPLNNVDWTMDFYAGVAIESVDQEPLTRSIKEDAHDRVAGLGIAANNFSRFSHAITESGGVGVQLQVESFDLPGGGTDHTGLASIIESRANIRFAKNQTLSLKVDAGVTGKNGKPFLLGGSTDIVDTLTGISRFGQREFSLRGYAQQTALLGTRFARASLAWHIPLFSLYNGFSMIPLGLGKVNASVFTEAGDAWSNKENRKALASLGLELNTEILIGYDSLLLPLTFGYASGLEPDLGKDQYYLKVNLDF